MLITSSDLKKEFGESIGQQIHNLLFQKGITKNKKLRIMRRSRQKKKYNDIMEFYGEVIAWEREDIINMLQKMIDKPKSNTAISRWKECVKTLKNLKEVESDRK